MAASIAGDEDCGGFGAREPGVQCRLYGGGAVAGGTGSGPGTASTCTTREGQTLRAQAALEKEKLAKRAASTEVAPNVLKSPELFKFTERGNSTSGS